MWAIVGLLAVALVFGGATRVGHLSDVIVQAVAVPVLVWGAAALIGSGGGALLWTAVGLAVLCVALPAAQLLPIMLPTSHGPAGLLVGEVRQVLGDATSALPVSIAPRSTLLALVSLIPALAMLVGTACLSRHERRWLTLAALALGTVSVFLGLAQSAQGPSSPLRFFDVTNPTEAVGFFANRNHFSALLYVLLVFAAAWGGHAAHRLMSVSSRRRWDASVLLPVVAILTLFVLLVATQTFTRSRAGLLLTIVALLGAAAISYAGQRGGKRSASTRLVWGAALAGVFLSLQFALFRVLERFEADPLADARIPFASNTLEAAGAHLPVGTGVGTFVPVYGLYETPATALLNTFANRAHNDFLEVWLETGLPGAMIFAGFAIWLAVAAARAWLVREGASGIDTALARAASLAILLLLLHSVVDYPLRTTALQCVLAMACVLLIPAPGAGENEPADDAYAAARPERGAARRRAATAAKTLEAAPVARTRSQPWGHNVAWPAEWAPSDARAAQGGGRPPAPAADASPSTTSDSVRNTTRSVENE
ncbi:MAG: O-antigen ligase family protein [Gammaproteobacteria bacterium]|nr:O-antigen ligase family protein [Gammaproteobacteria bacterium]